MLSSESLRRVSGCLDAAGRFFDSLLDLGERVGILLAVGLLAYAVFQLFFTGDDPAQTRSGQVLALINANWKAALLVIAPLFYRSLRIVVRRIRTITAGGVSFTLDNEAQPGEPEQRQRNSR